MAHIIIAVLAYASQATGIAAAAVTLADWRDRRERKKVPRRGRYVPRHAKR
jgi:Ni/Co efflux regulator RcnB